MNRRADFVFDHDAFLKSYKPRGRKHWDEVSDFVCQAAAEYFEIKSPTSRQDAEATACEIARLADFQFERTRRVSTKTVFNQVTVIQLDASRAGVLRNRVSAAPKAERATLTAQGEVTLASQYSRIIRIGRALNPTGGWDPKPLPRSRRVTVPTSPQEEAWLEDSVARNQGLARVNGEALLVLSRGAGLAGSRLLVRTTDCRDNGSAGIVIDVAGVPVPVLQRYEARLRALLAITNAGDLLIGSEATHKNAVGEAVRRVKIAVGGPALEPGRLRNAWIVEHLAAGTRVKELMRAAGLVSMTAISDMAAFVPALDEADATEMLRLAGGAR